LEVDYLPSFKLHGREISSIYQLMGYKENDISYSTAWVLGKCAAMLKLFIKDICGSDNFDHKSQT